MDPFSVLSIKIEKGMNRIVIKYTIDMTTYVKKLSEPWFTYTETSVKTVEGRLNKEDWIHMNVDDIIQFTNKERGVEKKFSVKIVKICHYDTFRLYLEEAGLKNCLPGVDTIEQGLDIYYKIYSIEDEMKYKVKAFHLQTIEMVRENP